MSTTLIQEYPVCYAEAMDQSKETPFYIEWLDNTSEFPGLTPTTLGNEPWELLCRKEQEEHPTEEVGDWAKVAGQPQLYADITQKNAIQPTTRLVQSLWPHPPHKSKRPKKEEDREGLMDELGAELFYQHKAHSQRSNRLSRRRQHHDMETVRLNMEVVFHLATSKNGTVNIRCSSQELDPALLATLQESDLKDLRIHNKAQALSFVAKYKHNTKKYNAVYAGIGSKQPKRTDLYDASDLPVVKKEAYIK